MKINYEDPKLSTEKFLVPITAQKNYENLFTPPDFLKFVRNEKVEEEKSVEKSFDKIEDPVLPLVEN